MYPHFGLHVVTAVPIGGNLQRDPLEGDTVVVTHRAFELFAQDVVETAADPGHKGTACFPGRLHELPVEGGQIGFDQIAIGRGHIGNTGQQELLRQPTLMGAKGPFTAAARFRRIGRDHFNAQPPHGPPKLRGVSLVDLAAGVGGMPVVAAAVAVERTEQSALVDDLTYPPEAAGRLPPRPRTSNNARRWHRPS